MSVGKAREPSFDPYEASLAWTTLTSVSQMGGCLDDSRELATGSVHSSATGRQNMEVTDTVVSLLPPSLLTENQTKVFSPVDAEVRSQSHEDMSPSRRHGSPEHLAKSDGFERPRDADHSKVQEDKFEEDDKSGQLATEPLPLKSARLSVLGDDTGNVPEIRARHGPPPSESRSDDAVPQPLLGMFDSWIVDREPAHIEKQQRLPRDAYWTTAELGSPSNNVDPGTQVKES